MHTDSGITQLHADALSLAIHSRQVSCREVMSAYLERIHRLNPIYNALVNLASDDALMAQADACDAELAAGHSRGWMHGMPQAIKDTCSAVGFPTTFGSPLLRDKVAEKDGVMAARMKAAGCIVLGKTNIPEFGLGSHTFNELFGLTPNAWDTKVSAGGSSGGAAVALAQRMLPVADGSDFMGSLRNPAGWNHVFGMRPSQGRVPFGPSADIWIDQLGTEGPMARHVIDLAKLLQIQSGHDRRLPLSLTSELNVSGLMFDPSALKGLRIGWLGDLDGHLPMEAGILTVCEQALQSMSDQGAHVIPMSLGFDQDDLWQCWLTWRRALVGPKIGALMSMANARQQIKPEALWEYDHSLTLNYTDFSIASQIRSNFYHHMLNLFDNVDVLALPVSQVWPFPVEMRWPSTIGSRKLDTYHRWMECTIYATLAGLPALSLPAGFHSTQAWPMGLQLVGQAQGDFKLLQIAAAYEDTHADLLSKQPVACSVR
jgi:amidase